MSGNQTRLQAIENVKEHQPPAAFFRAGDPPGEVFGQNVFTKAVMQKRLPKPVFKSVMATIEHSKPLDPAVADMPIVRSRIDNAKIDTVLSNSFGFGGTNATLVLQRYTA